MWWELGVAARGGYNESGPRSMDSVLPGEDIPDGDLLDPWAAGLGLDLGTLDDEFPLEDEFALFVLLDMLERKVLGVSDGFRRC